jgi:hypothetical protein
MDGGGPAPVGTPLSLAHQLSYVTSDIDAAVETLRRFGVERFLVRRDHSAPGSSGTIRHMALAYADHVMIEVVEPNPERPGIYEDALGLPRGALAFHHVGHFLTTDGQWDAAEALVGLAGLQVPAAGASGEDFRFSYPDARQDLDHFLEFSFRRGATRHPYDIPENPSPEAHVFPLLGGHFQRGYVCRDVDAAMARLSEAYGVARFHVLRDLSVGGKAMSRHIALAWIGRTQIELIEPDPDVAHSIYLDHLPPEGRTARLHHLGFFVEEDADFEAMQARLGMLSIPAPMIGDFGPVLRYLYADARPQLGHWIEYIQLRDQGRALFDSVPRN